MPTRQKSKEDIIKASRALYYEIMMLNECAKFSETFKNMVDHYKFFENILTESFCVHLRNLIEFFGKNKRDRITYELFMSQGKKITFPHDLSGKYNKKVNNLLSHLTFERLKFEQKEKTWMLSKITNEVNENLREFLKNADHNLLSDKLKNYIQGFFCNFEN